MDREVPVGVDSIKSHLHHFPNPILVDFVHAESLDIILFQQLLLSFVDISQPDVDNLAGRELRPRFKPREEREDGFIAREVEEEGNRHAVEVAAVGGRNCVEVGMRINPDHAGVGILTGLNWMGSGGSESLGAYKIGNYTGTNLSVPEMVPIACNNERVISVERL